MTRTLKRRAYAIALQLLLITSLAFVDGSRGFVSRRNGFVAARRLPQDGSVNEAIEETAAHEIAETFTETHEKIPKSSKREDDKESGVVRGGGESYKRKSRKGKLPDRPVAPKTSSTRAPGARLPTPKAMSGQKYPVIKTPKIKDETSMKDPQKPYMGSSKTPKGVKGKKDKAYQDRGKYPKGMKSIKDNEDKTIVPKFPGDDDDYDHYGDYDDGGGMGDDADSTATRAPRVPSTMAPTVPKDGRHDEDDDYYQDDYYYDDEVQNAAEREEEDDDGDDGDDALTDFGDGNVPILPDYQDGDNDKDTSSRLVEIVVPVGAGATLLACCLAVFYFQNRRKKRRPQDIHTFETKLTQAEEGTHDGTAALSDAKTFTFSEDGIEKYKRMVNTTQPCDKSSIIEEELREAMDSLEDFEEVSLHDDGEKNNKSSQSRTKTSLTDHLFGSAFRAPDARSKSRTPAIAESISRDDSSTSEIYVANKNTFEESDNDYESDEGGEADGEPVRSELDTEKSARKEDCINTQEEKQVHEAEGDENEIEEKESAKQPAVEDEQQKAQDLEENVIDLTTYEQETESVSSDRAASSIGQSPALVDHLIPSRDAPQKTGNAESSLSAQGSSSKKEDPPTNCAPLETCETERASPQKIVNDLQSLEDESDGSASPESPEFPESTQDTKATASSSERSPSRNEAAVDADYKPVWMKKAEERIISSSVLHFNKESAETQEGQEDDQPVLTKQADEEKSEPATNQPTDANVAQTEEDNRPPWMKKAGEKFSAAPPNLPSGNVTQEKGDDRPTWMKATLRSTSPSPSLPKKDDEAKVPEWMLKYNQMKFQKADN